MSRYARYPSLICELPRLHCPHCDVEFTACHVDVEGPGGELCCELCEGVIKIEEITIIDPDDPESTVLVTVARGAAPPEGGPDDEEADR